MPKIITVAGAAQTMVTRVDHRTLTPAMRRTPAEFLRVLHGKWHVLALAVNQMATGSEKSLAATYVAIREQLDRLGYGAQFGDSHPADRFNTLARATESILGKSTKSAFMFDQLLSRAPTFLDSYVIVSLWSLWVEDARDHKNSLAESDRLTRANQREIDRITRALTSNQRLIGELEAEATEVRRKIDLATRTSEDLLNQLHALSGGDSDPSPTARADSGHFEGLPRAPAGDSDRLLSEFRD